MVIRIKIINIIDMDEPKCQSPVHLNCCSIRLPIRFALFPPSKLDITKVLMAGTKTMVIPVITPGILKGKITLLKVVATSAPKSSEASNNLLSILVNTEYMVKP